MTDSPASSATDARITRRAKFARLAVLAMSLASIAACGKIAGIDDLQIGECKGGLCVATEAGTDDGPIGPTDDGSADGSTEFDGAGLPCTSAHGPMMVRVGTAANNFCIDSSEITVAQYREFTTAKGLDVGGQSIECTWNTSYAAGFGGADEIPVAGIDWCDARAYCAWAGKRLCGKHANGAFAGSVGVADLGDFNTHEWLLACSNIGQLRYPYGGIQQPTACNTGENDAGRTLPVKSKPSCQGGFPGVYDMIGNLWEWFDGPCLPPEAGVDAGDAGPAKEECFVKGGAFLNAGSNLDCRVDGRGATRDRRGQEIGFRCCAD
jgi:formylglycine-generating enzyme required for sulfatase activity